MQSNARKPDPGRLRRSNVTEQVRKVQPRKVPYRVGYSWNKGGRLKELRIRHLARKFLKIWMNNTFGRILPHKAKSHYKSVVLRRAFEGWRDEWWASRREWCLTVRAECHYRYYLYNLAFHSWRTFMSLQREKKGKTQNAQSFADKQRMRLVWERLEVFTEMRRMKNGMLESALELNRFTTLHSAWSLWQTRLRKHQDIYAVEDQALKRRALNLQSRAWLQWKKMYITTCCQKKKESQAALHFIFRLKRKTLCCWKLHVSHLQAKKKLQANAQRLNRLRMLMMYWSKWNSALHHKRREENDFQAADVALCREEHERNRIASQKYRLHLMHAGLQGLSLNIMWNKTHRLNNHIAVQHYCQTMPAKYWKLWQNRLEEAEDKSFQPLREMALSNYSTSLLSSFFHLWREKLAEQRHMQELEQRADGWLAEHMLPQCFNSWVEFTLQRRLHKQRRHEAEVYNQQRQYTWVFYTWWGRSEKHKDQKLSEQKAILHEEQCQLQRAWGCWRQQTEQQISEREKLMASDHLNLHRLLHKTNIQWKDNSTEIGDRRNREQQACHQGDLRCMRWAVKKWKQFVQRQQVKKSTLRQMQHYHEVKLLKQTFWVWKKHHQKMLQIYSHAEELCKQREQNFLRKVLSDWRENAALLTEVRFMERRAQNHFHYVLQLKVFLVWREATTHAVLASHQQREAVIKAQKSISQVRLLGSFGRWRRDTEEARTERICMEKAKRHHESKLLSTALKAWNEYHDQYHRNKVMKRQGILLLRLKMYQTYFEQWKVKLQHRRREAEKTERALWHWSLTLQAKVLHGWRLWVTEQRRKQEHAAQTAQLYRDQLLREGVSCILTYAAHMNDLTTSLTQHSQEQRLRHLQGVVKRCAMRWKQRVLGKQRREQEVEGRQPTKTVTFSLTPAVRSTSQSDTVEQEDEDEELRKLLLNRTRRRQPHRHDFPSPLKIGTQKQLGVTCTEEDPEPSPSAHSGHTVLCCVHPEAPFTSTHQRTVMSNESGPKPHMSAMESPQGRHVLLPPSAFMTASTKDTLEKSSSLVFGDDSLMPPLKQHLTADLDVHLKASKGETAATDPASAQIRELLSIQLDMKTYQHDREQLRAWKKLKEVLQSWLQTSGKDEQIEKNAVCQELKELEERIYRLSTELAERKPTMLLHAERIQHLQTVLTDHSVITTLQQLVLK